METQPMPTGNEPKEAIEPSFASPEPTESLTEIPTNVSGEVCTGHSQEPSKTHSEGSSTAYETEASESSPCSDSDVILDSSSDCATEDPNEKDWSSSEEQDTRDALAIEISPPKKKKQASNKRSPRRRQKVFERVSDSSKAAMTDEQTQKSKEDIYTQAEIRNLCSVNDYIETIQQNNLVPSAPISKSRNKRIALAEAVASAPADQKDAARADRISIDNASRKYYGLARHTNNKWTVRGIKTELYPHQLQAGAWMIDRENSRAQPHGGLLCHEQGLGKTLTMLSVVINDIASHKHPGNTTLIVVPKALVNHWMHEIHHHKDVTVIASKYCVGNRTDRPDLRQWFSEQHIVYELAKLQE
ncbi:unnamed protein product [Penicillium bialowiezense]